MLKAYVVTSGSYSDYTIERVFLNKEKAERYVKLCDNNLNKPNIEEYDIDDNQKIDEIVYVEGYYCKGGEMEVLIKKTNSLDDNPQELKRSWFDKLYNGSCHLTIRRTLSNNSFNEEKVIEKYEKVLYDLMNQVEYLMSTGWNEEMIKEWLNKKQDEYINSID